MTPKQRARIHAMFGGKCAYCGVVLDGKWHADHVEAVVRIPGYEQAGFGDIVPAIKVKPRMLYPENHRADNYFPACVRCNILKAAANVEGFRSALTYMAHSIPRIQNYSHVHHLMRFGKLTIDVEPVVFWFEKYRAGVAE